MDNTLLTITEALNHAAKLMRAADWDMAATAAAFVAFAHGLVATNSSVEIADDFLVAMVEQRRGAAKKISPPAQWVN